MSQTQEYDPRPTGDIGARVRGVEDSLNALEDTVRPALSGIDRRLTEFGSSIGAMAKQIRDLQSGYEPPKPRPCELLAQVFACHLLGAIRKSPAVDIAQEIYPGKQRVLHGLAHPGQFVERGITSPATTINPAWAAELAGQRNVGVIPQIAPQSIYAQLSQRGIRVALGANGSMRIISRPDSPGAGGFFVGEGAPIPVRALELTAAALTAKNAAVISYFTREIATYSVPAMESLIRVALAEDTTASIDGILLDANTADAIRPAGIRNGVPITAPTTGGDLAALVGDFRGLAAAITVTGGMSDPVVIVDEASAMMIDLLSPVTTLPVLSSASVPAKTMIMIDAGDYASIEGDEPDISGSNEAVLHASDVPLSLVDSAGLVASPQMALWQQACFALRLITQTDWTMRRPGRVAWTSPVTW